MKDKAKRKEVKGEQEGRPEVGDLLEKVTIADSERLSDEEFLTALWRRIALTVEGEEPKPTEEERMAGYLPERLPAIPTKHLAVAGVESSD
jgi:hypothetical protein